MSHPFSVDIEELEWEQVDELVRMKVIHGSTMTLTRYSFEPGGRFPHHIHDQEQLTMVIAGRLTFVIDGADHDLRSDSVVVIPSGLPHRAQAGPDGAEVVSVVSPARIEGRGITILEKE